MHDLTQKESRSIHFYYSYLRLSSIAQFTSAQMITTEATESSPATFSANLNRDAEGATIRKALISSPPGVPGLLVSHTASGVSAPASQVTDLVPVRLDFSIGTQFRFLDSFTWNLAGA